MFEEVGDYSLEDRLGQGTSGQVFKGRTKSKPVRNVAIKFIPKKSLSRAARENLINEISALKKLKHKFIVEMIDFSYTETHVYIAMEFANGGDLSAFIKKRKVLTENLARIFCQQLCSALLFMREHNISHMDLKPGNLLLHRPKPNLNPALKVADFGFAHNLEGCSDLGVRGSPLYMAPEIVLSKQYSPKVDIWSVGVILFEALFGRAPFSSATLDELIEKIKEDSPVVIPRDKGVSDECRRFLSACLQRDPDSRLDFKQMQDDPFLDLEFSIPHQHSAQELARCEKEGEAAEGSNNVSKAVEHFENALKYARTLYYYAEEESVRKKLKSSVQGIQTRLAELKPGGKESSKVSNVSPSLPFYSELFELSKGTPGLRDGLEICTAAKNYQMEGDIAQAVDRYTAGLGVLVPLLQKEPKGARRDLLHNAVMHWLQQAETLKLLRDHHNEKLQGMEGTKENERCSIQ